VNLKELRLYHFKNHTEVTLQFADKVNAIIGNNGVGKTNILDAVFYLANTKSYFNHQDNQLIQFGETDCSIMGIYEYDIQKLEIQITFGENRKKTVKKNGKPYPRLLDHIGQISAVFITPYDISLVFEGSEERRRFIDFTISQLNKEYLRQLVEYRKVIEQRNSFLKSLDGKEPDPILMESFNFKLIPLSKSIQQERSLFIQEFNPYFDRYYQLLSGEKSNERLSLEYQSSLHNDSIEDILLKNQRIDVASGRTTNGIHKDDLIIEINALPLKKFGSQGQIKSSVIALKLAQYQYLKEKSGNKPWLLLDDIFEKIDEKRSQQLMKLVCGEEFGQIFVSDTHAKRVKEHFDIQGVDVNYYTLE
jgi:DNA replication and repair protein RecF